MRVSLKWLADYTDIVTTPDDLAYRLTMAGIEVPIIERIGHTWDRDKIFVGQITHLAPHPNADRLQLATANYGRGTITVVTGAFNLKVGDKVPVALAGARLHNGHSPTHELITLKPTRLRGIPSEGMVCSALELGLGEDHSGILILDPDAPVGMPLVDYLGDTIFELEIKGRWDCLSMLGVAQEVAAIQRIQLGKDVPFRLPPDDYPEGEENISHSVHIEIWDPDLCPRYSAILIRDVTIGPSPRWLQERIIAAGMRPINNVVDITNYVMWEWGQPLHAFDYDKIHDHTIIVRRAHPGEMIVTLDGQERALTNDMCVIADPDRAVAIGGVMGGLDTEVTESTTNILLESANFLPTSIRRTARALGIPSEAQRRFEKGLPPEQTVPAARRAARLILDIAGGRAARGVADCYPSPRHRHPVILTTEEITRILGVDIPAHEVRRILEALGMMVEEPAHHTFSVIPPIRRTDISIPADIIEEIARIRGYDTMPTTMISGPIPSGEVMSPIYAWEDELRDIMVAAGFTEVITYALTNRQDMMKLAPPGLSTPPSGEGLPASVRRLLALDIEPLRLANPMTAEKEVLRTTAVPSLLDTLARNLRHQAQDVALFEIGRIYLPRPDDLPEERRVLTAAMGEWRSGRMWGRREANDFFDMKAVAEAILQRMSIHQYHFEPAQHPSFHPGRCAVIMVETTTHEGRNRRSAKEGGNIPDAAGSIAVGLLGEVHPDVRPNFDLKERAYILAMDLEELVPLAGSPTAAAGYYTPLPRFPAVMQDMAIVVDIHIPAARVEEVIRAAGGSLVSSLRLFDVYTGDPIPAGKRSLAYSIAFQATERTLTDEEVATVRARIEKRLAQELGATLRA